MEIKDPFREGPEVWRHNMVCALCPLLEREGGARGFALNQGSQLWLPRWKWQLA